METDSTDWLLADSFPVSSDPNAPPDEARIVGIEARAEGHHTVTLGTGSTTFGGFQYIKSGVAEGSVRGSGMALAQTTDAVHTVGATNDAWGTSLTGLDVKSATSGVVLWVVADVDGKSVDDYNVNVFIDQVQIRYTWVLPPKGARRSWWTRISRRAI